MSVTSTLATCSQTAASNGPDGTVDAPSTLDDAIRYALSFIAQLRDRAHQNLTAVSGTNAIVGTATGISSLLTGHAFSFTAAASNTAAVTLNVNSIGAKAVTKFGSTALAAGDIQSGSVVTVIYDGTRFQLQGVATQGGAGWFQNPSGKIHQWGVGLSSNTGDANVVFPIAFPSAVESVNVTPVNGGGAAAVFGSVGAAIASSFNFSVYSIGGARQVANAYWMADGT